MARVCIVRMRAGGGGTVEEIIVHNRMCFWITTAIYRDGAYVGEF
jgi:hypothetical protein